MHFKACVLDFSQRGMYLHVDTFDISRRFYKYSDALSIITC